MRLFFFNIGYLTSLRAQTYTVMIVLDFGGGLKLENLFGLFPIMIGLCFSGAGSGYSLRFSVMSNVISASM